MEKKFLKKMLSEQLQIYRDTFKLCQALLAYNNNISRTVRYGIYADCISMSCEALDCIYLANSDISKRYEALNRYICLMGGVRSRIRLLSENEKGRYLSIQQQHVLMLMLDKVNRQAIGWRNSALKRES